MESLREDKLFDIRLIGAARSGAGSLFSTHEKTALLSSRFDITWAFPMMDGLMSAVEGFERAGTWRDQAVQQALQLTGNLCATTTGACPSLFIMFVCF
jgi:hypothetical protein